MVHSMNTSDKEVGGMVRQCRESSLLSQQDLAAAMRVRGYKWSQATVWSVESGERALRYTEALELGELCGFGSTAPQGPSDVRRGIEMSMKALTDLMEKL